MNKFLIIADDLTGANDTGVKLTNNGIPVKVYFSAFNITPRYSCVIDTETRNVSESKAYDKVKTIMASINLEGFDYIYKKVDSTLRGNIVSELKAICERIDPDYVVFDPALPALGRQVINEKMMVNNVELDKTEFAHDPIKPIVTDNIKRIMEETFNKKLIQYFNLKALRFNEPLDLSKKYFGFVSENDDDLAKVVNLFQHMKGKILWIGSSGLIDAITKNYESNPPAMAIVGSVSEKTREQLRYAQENGLEIISLPIYQIYSSDSYSKYVEQAVQILKKGKNLALVSSASLNRSDLEKTKAKFRETGIKQSEIENIVQTILAGICRRVINKYPVSGLLITGGSTAQGVLKLVKAQGTTIKEEIAFGMPLLKINGGEFDGINMISKAGAFGDSSLIMFGLNKLRSLGKKE